ncbi:MAG TPA: hypothetical protein V6D50_13640 [Chroococcales cyanobacterium]
MSQNSSSPSLIRQLSVGDVVNISIQLYRSNLKLYLRLALVAHLWLLVPLYGWARFYTIAGLISRLTFNQLLDCTENISSVRSQLNRRLVDFAIAGFFVFIMCWLGSIVLAYLVTFLIVLVLALFSFVIKAKLVTSFMGLPEVLLGSIILAIALLLNFWLNSRLWLTELPLATEPLINFWKSIKSSCKLTKKSCNYLQGIILIAFSIALPITVIVWIGFMYAISFLVYILPKYAIPNSAVSLLFLIISSSVAGIITMPFWQSVKAVAYYDIRCRQEGLDLKLSNLPRTYEV